MIMRHQHEHPERAFRVVIPSSVSSFGLAQRVRLV